MHAAVQPQRTRAKGQAAPGTIRMGNVLAQIAVILHDTMVEREKSDKFVGSAASTLRSIDHALLLYDFIFPTTLSKLRGPLCCQHLYDL